MPCTKGDTGDRGHAELLKRVGSKAVRLARHLMRDPHIAKFPKRKESAAVMFPSWLSTSQSHSHIKGIFACV